MTYFEYLCHMIDGRGFEVTLKAMYSVPFEDIIEHDEDRITDAINLQFRYLDDGGDVYEMPRGHRISVFEVLIALAERMTFIMDEDTADYDGRIRYFWEMMHNLKLDKYDNAHPDVAAVQHICQDFVERNYKSDGTGGAFPRKDVTGDTRKLDLWYQMNGYLIEKYGI